MAYSIEFAPAAHKKILELTPNQQRKILLKLEKEASAVRQKGDKNKRLRRMNIDDTRLVYLELHPQQQLMILKIAENHNLYNALGLGDDPPIEELPED